MFPLKNTGNAEGSSFAFPLTRRGVFRSGFRPRLLTVSGNVADVTCPLDWKCQESAFIQRTNNSNLKRDEPLEAESMTRCIRQLQFGGYFFFFWQFGGYFFFFDIFYHCHRRGLGRAAVDSESADSIQRIHVVLQR